MTNTPKGTITWYLCRRGLDFFTRHLYHITRNGRETFLWDDKIKGNAPLNYDSTIAEIKAWLVNKGFLQLSDITSWDSKGNLAAWVLPALPDHGHPLVHSQFNLLLVKLT